MTKRQVAVLMMLCASACSDATETRQSAVVGGEADDSSGVIGLVHAVNGSFGQCSGVLVAPNLVLTARGCVATKDDENFVVCGQTMFTGVHEPGDVTVMNRRVLDPTNTSENTQVADIRVPEATDVCGADIAMLVLSEPLDGDVIEPALDGEPAAGQAYTVHGYGPTEVGGLTSSRNSGPGTITCVGAACSEEDGVEAAEFLGVDGACGADGGGPVVDDSGRAIGLVVRGSGQCEASIHTSIAAWGDWIKDEARSASDELGFEAPSWAAPASVEDMGSTDMGSSDVGAQQDEGTNGSDAAGTPGSDEGGGCATASSATDSGVFGLFLLAAAWMRRRR